MGKGAIDADPQPGIVTRSQFSDTEIDALIATTYGVRQIAPGLVA